MKIRLLLISLTGLTAFTACNTTPASYRITGQIENPEYEGKTIYLSRYDNDEYLDSCRISNGMFEIKGQADTAFFCRLDAGGYEFANLILENEEIKMDMKKHIPLPSKSALNNSLSTYIQAEDSLHKVMNHKREEFKTQFPEKADSLSKVYYENEWNPEYMSFLNKTFENNHNNGVGVAVIMSLFHNATTEERDHLFEKAGKDILCLQNVQKLIALNNQSKKTAVGMPFTDFTVETKEGGKVSLSDYVGKGKYTLVDFWASWCGPCREETPAIAEIYKEYKDKGLTVLGVAVWDEQEKSQKAIQDLHINWPQILNAQKRPMELYGIKGIPHIILFGPDGTILARGLRGDKIKEKIKEVL